MQKNLLTIFFNIVLLIIANTLWGMDGPPVCDNDTELEMLPLVSGVKKQKYFTLVIDSKIESTNTYFDYLPPEIVEKILIYVLNSKEFELATQEQDDDGDTSLVSALENLNLEEGLPPHIKPLHINIQKLSKLSNAQKRSCSQNLLTALEGNHELYLQPGQAYTVLVYILNRCNQEFAALPDKSSFTVEELLEKFKQTFAHTSLIERAVVLSQEEYNDGNIESQLIATRCGRKDSVGFRCFLCGGCILFSVGFLIFMIYVLAHYQDPVALGLTIPSIVVYSGVSIYALYKLYLPDCCDKVRRI